MRVRFVLLSALVAGTACTGGTPARPSTSPLPAPPATVPSTSNGRPIVLDVVATVPQPGASVTNQEEDDAGYLEGMRLAVDAVNGAGGVKGRPLRLRTADDLGDPAGATAAVRAAIDRQANAVLYAGPGTALTPLRDDLALAGTPVMLLGGDLYTSRQLFSPVFQASIPWEWQARVIAKYLVTDRRARDIVFVGSGPEAPSAAAATDEALRYWGGRLAGSYLTPPPPGSKPPARPASKADAAIVFGTPYDVHAEAGALDAGARRPRIAGGESLLVPVEGFDQPPPGTIACYAYTWAGWAHPVHRVRDFTRQFRRAFGRLPVGLEQEGYDAVRLLALGLRRDGLRGGGALTSELERIQDEEFSSFPITLGPDDHMLLPRDEIGLFAVPGADERLDPWQVRGEGELWRPLMRTFTYDGRRDDILDQDKRVFFPSWQVNQPGPYYWKSRYGIRTRPKDPLH